MSLGDLIDMINKEKRKNDRAQTAKRLAAGAGVVAMIGVTTGVLITTKIMKYSAAHATKEVCDIIKGSQESIL